MQLTSLVALALVASLSVACTLGAPAEPGGPASPEPRGDARAPSAPSGGGGPSEDARGATTSFATAAEQVAAGQALFTRSCTGCHGAAGLGGRGPRLIGLDDGALSRFDDAEGVARFVTGNMPVANANEAYAVVAWLIGENGVETGDQVLDAAVAPTIKLR